MDERLQDIKAVFKQWCRGKGSELDVDDIEWLIEQAETLEKLKNMTELRVELTEDQIKQFKKEWEVFAVPDFDKPLNLKKF